MPNSNCLNWMKDFLLQLCKKHHFGIDKPDKPAQSPDESKFLMKTFSQIKSNVAVPIKKKVMLGFFFAITCLSTAFSFTLGFWKLWVSHSFLLSLLCRLAVLLRPPTQSSIPLPSRSRRTRRRSVSRGGSWTSCTKYSWTRTPSTTVWPTTWQTVCSARETRTSPTPPCGNRWGTLITGGSALSCFCCVVF